MKRRAKALKEYGEQCGFVLEPGTDGRGHHVMRHPNGERVHFSATPGDWRGDLNCRAEMRAKSGVTPPRARSGNYRRGVSTVEAYRPATVRVESKSRATALLTRMHRELCDLIEQCRVNGDRETCAEAVEQLLECEDEFYKLGVQIPLRRFRVGVPGVEE